MDSNSNFQSTESNQNFRAQTILPNHTLKELSKLNPKITFLHIALEWSYFFLTAFLCFKFFSWPLYLISLIIIGSRQHALAILMHESAHYRFITNKKWNDLLGNFFCGWPVFLSVQGYRASHFPHHQHTNTDKDPDWTRKQNEEWKFPKAKTSLYSILLKDLFGINIFQQFSRIFRYSAPANTQGQSAAPSNTAIRVAYYSTIFFILTIFGGWKCFFLFWIIPFFSTFKVFLRIRSIAEHFGVENSHIYNQTRTTNVRPLEGLILGPKNINFHLEHHLFPSVPFYNLPKLHSELMKNEQYRSLSHITNGYLGVLDECTKFVPVKK